MTEYFVFMGEMFQVGEQFLPIPVGIRERLQLKQGQGFDLSIQFDLNQLFLFDPTTGNTLYPVGRSQEDGYVL